MEFLLAVVGVLIMRAQGALPGLHRDGWFYDWVQRLRRYHWVGNLPYGRLLIAVGLPGLGVALLAGLFDGDGFSFWLMAIDMLVLLYAFGRGDLEAQVAAYREDLDREDFQAAYHDAAAFNVDHREGQAENWDELHRESLAAIPYRYFERLFPVIFWFLLAGAPGALIYRLSALFREGRNLDAIDRAEAETWLWLLEWLPVRLLGLVFALVGNFSTTISQLREVVVNTSLSTDAVLRRCVTGALDIPEDVCAINLEGEFEVTEIAAVSDLFHRALVLWLCLAGLWAVINA